MQAFQRIIIILMGAMLTSSLTRAQTIEPVDISPPALVVGTKSSPPFVIKHADGSWGGISIELWEAIADKLELNYTWREFDLRGLLMAVEDGEINVAVGALTITADRERFIDFTHPFYQSGLSVAVTKRLSWPIFGIVRRLISFEFLGLLILLILVLVLMGSLVWLCERKRNPVHFGGTPLQGIGAGIWWAAVTMTTVGYGDKIPITSLGRLVGLAWMYMALILVARFVAAFTAVLTVAEISHTIDDPEDLSRALVATVPASSSEAYLKQRAVRALPYATSLDGLRAVARGEVDAIVYDDPLLRYLTLQQFPGQIEILPFLFAKQNYGLALPDSSPLRESINQELLRIVENEAWQVLLQGYLGRRDE